MDEFTQGLLGPSVDKNVQINFYSVQLLEVPPPQLEFTFPNN
jgi:hypothetical protein